MSKKARTRRRGGRAGEWLVVGVGVSIASAALLLLGAGWLISSGTLEPDCASYVVPGAVLLGTAAGAAAGTACKRQLKVYAGCIIGGTFLMLLGLAALFSAGNHDFSVNCIKTAISTIGGGAVGGALVLGKTRRFS